MNTTFTTCAEKKAKQFLNLLQGYTKGIRMTAILILLLMGVNNAWAVDHTGGYVYFLKPSTWTESKVMMFIGHNSYTSVYEMTKVSNTDNLYRYTMPSWGGATYVAFANAGSVWGSGSWGPSNRTNAPHYTNVYNNYGFNSGSYYVVVPASTSNNAGLTINYKSSAANLNLTTKAIASDKAHGTVSVSGYYMSAYNTASTRSAVSSSASNATASTTLAPGSTATFKATASTGYEFEGWYDAATGGTAVSTSTTYNYPYGISYTGKTLYARFSIKKHTVNFDVHSSGNGTLTAKVGNTSINFGDKVNYGSEVVFTATPSAGYQIEGWYSNSACTTPIDNGTNNTYTVTITGGTNVYVKFEAIPVNSHNITYTAEGTGWTYGNSNPTTAEEGATVTFVVNPTAGYRVSVSSDGPALTGPNANNQYTFTMPNKDVKISVEAKPEQYTVTLNKQSGEGGTSSVTATYLAAMPSITAPTRTGYTFNGYFDATSGGTKYYNANGSSATNWDKTAATTLYAQWSANKYTVTFNANDGTGTMSNQSFEYDETKPLTANAFTRKGYEFTGWNTQKNGSGNSYSDKESVSNLSSTDGATVTLYAQWNQLPPTTVYINPKTDWEETLKIICDGEEADMTPVGCDGRYTAEVPGGTTELKFGGNNETTLSLTIPQDDKVLYDMASTNITKLYLKANSNWKADGARFAAYFFGNGEKWVSMTAVADQTDLYEVAIPTDKSYPSVIFCRMNGGNQTNNWDNRWNQTEDLTIPTNGTNTAQLPSSITTGVTWRKVWDNSCWTTYEPSNTYTISFDRQGATTGSESVTATFGEKPSSIDIPERAGYTFNGYYTTASEGTQIIDAEGKWINGTNYVDADGNWISTDCNITFYAQWTANTYTVTLDQTGAASTGTEEVTAHYEADMPDIDELPVAQDGYAFMGYFDQKDGKGTQYYDSVGTSAHTWDKTEKDTLYAYFKAAEITIGLNAASFEPNSATPVIATATLKPKPVGTTSICWELLYNDDTPVAEHDPQPTGEPNKVQFNINDLATGTYQIKATLREGTGCTGTIISHATQVFTITSDHTITIRYVDENGQTIKASTTQSAHVSSLTEITAPEIIGYTFKEWEAGDGVSIKDATDGKKNTPTIEYNAYYDGYLKAIYTINSNIIYFYNTLGWENVYIFYYNNNHWDNNSGTGAYNKCSGHAPMQLIEGTNIWYVDASGQNTTYLVFAKDYQIDKASFFETSVARRGDYNNQLPMFVPVADQAPTMLYEGKTAYYNKGYWMNYPENTGYRLDLFNHYSANDPARYFIYPYSQDTIFPLQIQVDINAENIADDGKKKIWFRIHRNDGKNFGGNANTFPSVKPGTTGGFITENDYKVELITPIAGTYTFILDYKYDETAKDYKYHISVDYPAAVGDYRILYRDVAEKTWSGKDKNKEGDKIKWYHASRVIKKGTDTKDIISFFINKDIDRALSYQTIEDIDEDGNITWSETEEVFTHVDWSQIDTSGVYNFVFVQDGKGISVENDIVPYTGNYYIRCDAMDGNWEDYKTNPDNRMFYSAFSESEANSFGDKFSHYATKWCEAGTNVKFTIANDYSHCISDTLAQDIIPLGNLTDEGTLLNNDIYDANIRFMWNRKTNKISRAYVGPAGDKQSQFLMLRSCSEFKDAVGNDLDPNEGDILDKENDIYAARFTDTENWLYERTIQVKPRTRVKLYASYPNGYHIYIENLTGWKDVALYAWKDGGDQPLGNWPGIQPSGTVEIDSKIYYDFQVSEYVFGSKLKFNNNNNGSETSEYNISEKGDYYLTASSNSQLLFVKKVSTTVEATAQYFRGAYAEGSCDNENTVQILGGEGDTWNTIRVIYDFKTNRLMAAWMPNNNEIDTVRSIESDVMIIRDHQDAAQCITFANDSSKLTYVKTVYGVMRFNRWILNNRGGQDNLDVKSCGGADSYDENTTNSNHPVLQPAEQKSQYERALYFISFPFDVHLSDVFGFGTYGQHWIIEYYDGLKRAKEGYWIDSDPNWKYVTDPSNFVLEKYKGYILCLNLGKMAYDNTDFWAHNISQVELFFPSTTTMEEIAKAEVTMPKLGEEYLCKINRGDGTEGDRRVKDSYWRCIGVPSYANYSNVLKDEEGNPIQWQTSYKTFPFLYKWNKTDNTLTPQSTTNFKFETMHAYLVQNGGEIHWSAVNATPDKPNAGIIAKVKEITRNYEWRITLTQGEKEHDQTFVRLSDDEKVTTEFDFNQDLSKEFNYGRSDIYTLIGYEKAAANSLPFSEQTTLIPLGLSIEYNGDYTIAMPDGTANIGVTLIDIESNTRTNLSAGMEYTLTLKKGDYNNRFFIEISPIQQTPTDIEYVENSHDDQARKVLIDNILYIVRDGQIFDARGAKVK